jgi:hypothetical protein
MNKLLKIVIGIVVVFILAVVAIFYFTSGMTKTANAFFESIKKQDIATAHKYLSEDFKSSTDEAALKEFLTKGALLKFKETSWSNRQVSGGRGELDGEVITETGGVIPLKLMFVKENGEWRIYGIQKPTAGLQTEETSQNIPSKTDQVALVKQSMRDFATSVNAKSMAHFHATTSQTWQKQYTIQKLDEAFKPYIESELDLTVLDNIQPIIEPITSLGENQELVIKGYYPSKPSQAKFTQTYIFEGVEWKLLGFHLKVE